MKIFQTFNPHCENLSQKGLLTNFRKILQKYYRKELGSRYFKHKDKQFQIGIFQEIGTKTFKQPHLHTIVDIPMGKINQFHKFLKDELKAIYPSLTDNCQIVGTGKYDEQNVYAYCQKEGLPIITNKDLYERITPVN